MTNDDEAQKRLMNWTVQLFKDAIVVTSLSLPGERRSFNNNSRGGDSRGGYGGGNSRGGENRGGGNRGGY
jgi:hypothetical protein